MSYALSFELVFSTGSAHGDVFSCPFQTVAVIQSPSLLSFLMSRFHRAVPQRTVLLSPALSELIVYNGIPAPSLSFVVRHLLQGSLSLSLFSCSLRHCSPLICGTDPAGCVQMQDSFLNTVFHFSDTKDRSACIVSTTSVIQAVGTLCAPVGEGALCYPFSISLENQS